MSKQTSLESTKRIHNGVLFSPCCDAFVIYSNNNIICSQCGDNIYNIEEGDEISTSIEYNILDGNNGAKNVSQDIINNQLRIGSRLCKDVTLAISSIPCPKCKSETILAKDQNQEYYFICTNENCRNVFRKEDTYKK